MTEIIRPMTKEQARNQTPWLLKGPWGERTLPPMSATSLYQLLHKELIASGVLPSDSPMPSHKHYSHVADAVAKSTWKDGRWVLDKVTSKRAAQN